VPQGAGGGYGSYGPSGRYGGSGPGEGIPGPPGGVGPGGPPVKRRGGAKKRSRLRTTLKWTAISLVTVLVATSGFAAYVYKTTVGDLKHTPLLPKGVTQAPLPVDPFGNTAMNIVLIGSDTRDTSADCSLGGDCGPGANGDGELILHVSADRSNITVMSIPRDTETNVPQCSTDSQGQVAVSGSYYGMINSALQYGPECQVLADHDLTGITITGYIMFDFGGVVSMSNAIGGVPVCVTAAVDDQNSGLQLPAGDSTVQGIQALEFLRTRDSFFDGSDLGREETTHYFFSQMIRTIRSRMNLGSVTSLLSLGQAAASSTTVSDNFSGIGNLEGLIETLNKVPTGAITFVTMPWQLDPNNDARVQALQPDAQQMFRNIQDDVSYSAAQPSASGSASAGRSSPAAAPAASSQAPDTSDVDKGQVTVDVYNADGMTNRATDIANALASDGFTQAIAAGDLADSALTEVYYPPGASDDGAAVAAALGIPSTQTAQSDEYSTVTVVVGQDFDTGTTFQATAGAGGASATGAATAPADSSETNALDSANECIPVESGNLNMATQP
jgi:LCP family protein required for cell wall assembly